MSLRKLARMRARQRKRARVINIEAPNYVGSRDELRRALIDLDRRGQLAVIKR